MNPRVLLRLISVLSQMFELADFLDLLPHSFCRSHHLVRASFFFHKQGQLKPHTEVVIGQTWLWLLGPQQEFDLKEPSRGQLLTTVEIKITFHPY